MQEGRIIYDATRKKMLHVKLKGLEHRILGCDREVLILKYNLDMGFSEEML